MQYFGSKAEAVEAAREMRAQGATVKVYAEVRNIPASGNNKPYAITRYFVKAV